MYVSAQEANSATTPKPVDLFYSTVNESAHLYNGTEYIMYDQHIKGDPYFTAADFRPGSVFYDGTLYENVPMLYELTTDNVIIRRYNQGVLMALISEKISYFKLLDHLFVHLVPDSTNKNIITNGFYDRIYNGNTVVYVKRSKITHDDAATFDKAFMEDNKYFIYKINFKKMVQIELYKN